MVGLLTGITGVVFETLGKGVTDGNVGVELRVTGALELRLPGIISLE